MPSMGHGQAAPKPVESKEMAKPVKKPRHLAAAVSENAWSSEGLMYTWMDLMLRLAYHVACNFAQFSIPYVVSN